MPRHIDPSLVSLIVYLCFRVKTATVHFLNEYRALKTTQYTIRPQKISHFYSRPS